MASVGAPEEKALRQFIAAVNTALQSEDDGATFEALLSLDKSRVPGAGPNLVRAALGVSWKEKRFI